jgi:hypothetical protein
VLNTQQPPSIGGHELGGVAGWLASVPIPVWLGILAALVLLMSLRGGRRRTPRIYARQAGVGNRLGKAIWRSATGAHMDGELRTDAGWWERGKKDLTRNEKAPRWAYLPRGVRALIRWGVLLAAVLWIWGYIEVPGITGVVTLVLVAGMLALAIRQALRRRAHGAWRSRHVVPLAADVAPLVGWDQAKVKPDEWINLPRTLGRDFQHPVVLLLPPGFWGSQDQRMRVDAAVAGRIGVPLSDLEIHYETDGDKPRVTYTQYAATDPALRADSGIGQRERWQEGETR